jgi:4-hydroxy-4-methyl-2-oxoglutarate aldolase
MSSPSDGLRAEMLSYDSCLISDVLEKLELPFGIATLKRQATTRRIFGRAVTVRLVKFSGEIPKKHLGTAAIEAASPGDVIVIEHQARADCAGWGGLLSTAAKAKGISGVVVDGLVRDVDESAQLEFPVFARGVTPVTARGKVVELATNVPVDLAGVQVRPGDFVMADGSGVVVIPESRLDEVVAEARAMTAFEDSIRAGLDAGVAIGSAMSASYENLLARTQ